MRFQINIDAETADHDADVMDRFAGTAIKITSVTVNKRAE